jgi:hypothetical protein
MRYRQGRQAGTWSPAFAAVAWRRCPRLPGSARAGGLEYLHLGPARRLACGCQSGRRRRRRFGPGRRRSRRPTARRARLSRRRSTASTRTTSTPYSPKQAIEHGATVETRYEPRLVEVARFGGEELDRSFEALVDDLPEEKQEKVRDDAARLQVIAKAPARIEAIAADAAYYLRERTFPQGFKVHGAAAEGAGGVRNPV